MTIAPGPVILLGSGETSPSIRKVYDDLFERMGSPVAVSILETPAGFEPNSAYVAGQIGAYLQKHLQNHRPEISIVPARKRGTPYSPDDPDLLTPLYGADCLFMGPGSPSYATRQLRGSIAWRTLQACHRLGAALIFASAATIACSRFALPVYEIYKVGEDLHWKEGLDFFAPFGLNLIFIPHWNNSDGGQVLDTSHCYIGAERYKTMMDLLPGAPERTVVGIDENTALMVEIDQGTCHVQGRGSVTVITDDGQVRYASGKSFDVGELGQFRLPADYQDIGEQFWVGARERRMAHRAPRLPDAPDVPSDIMELVERREAARSRRDWASADRLRDKIEAIGWRLRDTANGTELEPVDQ